MTQACETAVNSDALAEQTNTGLRYRGPDAFESFVRQNAEMNQQILEDAGLTE